METEENRSVVLHLDLEISPSGKRGSLCQVLKMKYACLKFSDITFCNNQGLVFDSLTVTEAGDEVGGMFTNLS